VDYGVAYFGAEKSSVALPVITFELWIGVQTRFIGHLCLYGKEVSLEEP
jgi:hypothetical protein